MSAHVIGFHDQNQTVEEPLAWTETGRQKNNHVN